MIDAFPHILPGPVYDRMIEKAEGPAKHFLLGMRSITALYDLELRFRVMDRYAGYVQVLTLATPPIEQVAGGATGRNLAEMANDSMAELCQRHPERFLGFAASLPMDDVDAAMSELERATGQLEAVGVQLFTNVCGGAPDHPRYEPIYARMSELNKPIWAHGARSFEQPDYVDEDISRFGLWHAFGWPFEMTLYMSRIALTGWLDKYPNLRILTHHGGGMTANLGQRFAGLACQFTGPGHEADLEAFQRLTRPPVEYLKMFYADTTVGAELRAIRDSVEFFGVDHVLFGSDMPFGPPGGAGHLDGCLESIDALGLTAEERDKLLSANARRFLGG